MSLYPTLRYRDPLAAVAFLERAFGFERLSVHEQDGQAVHVELRIADSVVMIGRSGAGDPRFESGKVVLYVVTDDPDAHYDRAKAAGAEIIMELTDQEYGSREYAATDTDGNVWCFGTYDPLATR